MESTTFVYLPASGDFIELLVDHCEIHTEGGWGCWLGGRSKDVAEAAEKRCF